MGHERRGTAEERGTGLVRRAVEAIWNRGDLELADLLFAPAYVNHGGLIPDLVRGPEAIKFSVALYRAAFPGVRITVEALQAAGELVELQWTAHRAPPGGKTTGAPEGHGGILRGTTRCRIAADQIAESWTAWDQAGVLQRLGIVLSEEGRIRDAARHA